MLLDSTIVFVFFHLSAQSNLGLLKKGELFDYRQIEGNKIRIVYSGRVDP